MGLDQAHFPANPPGQIQGLDKGPAVSGAGPGAHPIQTDADLAAYYARRAPEMEEVYALPERQSDLQRLRQILAGLVRGEDVLEVACGTGYWTAVMAASARSVTATDVSAAMLELARAKTYGPGRVVLLQANAWRLGSVPGHHSIGTALFWWSHMPKSRIGAFLAELDRVLPPEARLIFADNLPTDCRRTAAVGVDAEGNSYQRRRLRTGEQFDIIKNYPGEDELRAALAGWADQVEYTPLQCMWLLTARKRCA